MHSAASSQPQPHSNTVSTLQQLLGAFSSPRPRQFNGNSIPGSPGIDIDIGTAPYCYRLLLVRLDPLFITPNTTCPVAPMQAPTTNHISTTMQPRPSHGGFPGKLRTLSLIPLLFSPVRNTYPAIPMPLGPIHQIAITTGPRPTHGGYPPTALHKSANHPQTNNSTYPRALKRGGRKRREGGARPPPQLLSETHPPVLKPLKLDSSLYSTSLPDTKTTLPLLIIIIGGCRLVQQHPLSLPIRGFRNNGGLDLNGLGVWGIGSATLRPPLRRDTVGLRRAATPHLAR